MSPFELRGAEDGGLIPMSPLLQISLSTVDVAVAAAAAFVVAVTVAFVVAAASCCCCYCCCSFLLLLPASCFLLWLLESGHPLKSVPIGTL